MQNRIKILGLGAIASLAACQQSTQEETQKKYNVLFIMSDDLNDNLGCYGHDLVKSPNLDKLASKGVVFSKAYCSSPICGPSRVSMLTSLRVDTTNVIINESDFRDYVPDAITLPQLFMNSGYVTGRTGKLYHYGVPGEIGTDGHDDTISWNIRVNPLGRDKLEEDKLINFTPKKSLGGAFAFLQAEGTDLEQTDGMVATEAIKMMAENKDKPFFIAAGFFRPHCPYVAPKKYFDLYDTADIKLHVGPENDRDDIPEMNLSTGKIPNRGATPEQQKLIIQAYYASISFMDAQVGRLLDGLDSLGLAENTIVMFMSDHGYGLGQHGLWQKYYLFEEANKLPMMMYVPGADYKNKKVEEIVELLDVYPTLAEICGLEAPNYIHGTSMVPILEEVNAPWKNHAVMTVGRSRDGKFRRELPNAGYENLGRSVRTPHWRYNEWGEGEFGEELYDQLNDPGEFINLAGEPEYKELIDSLRILVRNKGKIVF